MRTYIREYIRKQKYMRKIFIRKLQKTSTHSYVINIPKELINQFKWCEKQKIEIVFKGKKGIVIKDYKEPKRKRKKKENKSI